MTDELCTLYARERAKIWFLKGRDVETPHLDSLMPLKYLEQYTEESEKHYQTLAQDASYGSF